jgi:hypothetical protein
VAYGSGFVVNPSASDFEGIMSGTSMATAVVSGVAAAYWSFVVGTSPSAYQVMNRLDTTGEDVGVMRTTGGVGPARKIRLCTALAGLPGAGACPPADALALAAPSSAGEAQQGQEFASAACALSRDEPCEAREPVKPWVMPQPGWPGCKECRYDVNWDALSITMTPELQGFGPTVMRFRSWPYVLDVRYEQTALGNPIPLPGAFWSGLGIPDPAARPQSGTVQFGVYVGSTFFPTTYEEAIIVTK